MKKTINDLLNNPRNRWFQLVNDVLAAVTLLSIGGIVLESVKGYSQFRPWFIGIEYAAAAIFGLEYLARLYSVPSRWRYAFSFFGLVDLVAILPSFLQLANLTFLKSARVLRILRMLRLLRLAKLAHFRGKAADAEHQASVYWINVQIYFFSLFSAVLLLGSVIYVIEYRHPGFGSIPAGMLWAADVILGGGIQGNDAQTLAGQLVTLVARFIGLALLGVLVAVVGTFMKGLLFGAAPAKPKRRKTAAGGRPRRRRIDNPDS